MDSVVNDSGAFFYAISRQGCTMRDLIPYPYQEIP